MTKRILYLEDDPTTRNALCYVMEQEGYDVVSYGSAEEALHELQQCDVGIAILDVRLPGRSGDDFGRELAEKHPAVQILFLTSEQDIDKIRHLIPTSMVIRKPVDMHVLLELLRCKPAGSQRKMQNPPGPIPFPPQTG